MVFSAVPFLASPLTLNHDWLVQNLRRLHIGMIRELGTAIGDATEVGRISSLIASAHEIKTPLTRKIAQFSRVLLVAILALSALTFHDPVALTVVFSDEKRETRNFIGGSLGLGVSVG